MTTVFVPAGGGGLLSGVSVAIQGMRSGVRIVGVEPEGAPKMSRSRAAGHPVTLDHISSIADGLLAVRPGDLTFAHVQALVDDVMTVTDDQIKAALRWLFTEASLVAEPSGAAAVAGALARGSSGDVSVAIVSGGNVDPAAYATYITDAGSAEAVAERNPAY